MKIVCDACAAKYSIADEKVAGKVFKIRCKKCSNVIVVRGNAESEANAPEQLEQKETRVFDYSGYDNPQDAVAAAESSIADGAVWHVVVDQEQVGPLTPEEVRAHHARGDIDGESFIWREGFADWERVDSLPEFADLAANANVDDAAAAMFGGPALDDGAGAGADPADLFTAQSAEPMAPVAADAGLFGGAADDGGLFGGAVAAASEPSLSASAEDKLKGERNENSVLFSLNNLASLASDAPKAAPVAAASPSSGMAQAGGQEGSGLIDIRAMASMYVGNSDKAGSPTASIDDLPVFSQPAITSASPVLMPVAAPANNNKLLVALIAGIGALVLVAVLLVVLVLRGGSDSPTTAANSVAGNDNTGEAKAGDGDGEAKGDGDGDGEAKGDGDVDGPGAGRNTAGDAKAAADAKKAEAEAEKKAAAEKREAERLARAERLKNETPSQRRAREKKEKKDREKREKKREEAKRKREEAKRKADAAKAAKADTSTKGGCDELDCLVNPNKSCCKKKKGGSSSSSKGDSSLPSRPPKSSLSRGMGRARGSAKSCASKSKYSGAVKVRVKVAGSGRVSGASASGGPGKVNSCVASAVKRKAKFPKSQNGISFSFTFRF